MNPITLKPEDQRAARLSDLAHFFNCSIFDVPRLPVRLVLQADEWLQVKNDDQPRQCD
jgi:hypothetical protein